QPWSPWWRPSTGWLLVLVSLHDDADAVVGQQERDVLEALGDREQQERHGRLRVAAQHPRRHPQLGAVVGADVFLERVQQPVVVHVRNPNAQRAGPGGRSGPARGQRRKPLRRRSRAAAAPSTGAAAWTATASRAGGS